LDKPKPYGLINTTNRAPNSGNKQLLDLDVSPLVPQQYAAYRPLVADALLYFTQHLPPHRAAAIFEEQQKLPRECSLSQRFAALMHQCPTLHKLGQVLARDRRLSLEFRRRLQTLESMEPAKLSNTFIDLILCELKGYPISRSQLATKALAEASVAIVIPFSNPEGNHGELREGVLKVLKPGVEERLEEELEIWLKLSSFIDERCEDYGIPALNYAETLETLHDLLANEILLDQEQRNLAQAAEFYADLSSVHIPKLLPYCTRRVTAMERIHGNKVTQTQELSQKVRRALASTLIKTLIARPIWNTDESSLFHADPHAGNLFYTDSQRLAVLDWSLVGHLGKVDRIQTTQLMLGALTLDAKRIACAIEAMGCAAPNESALRREVDTALGQLYKGRRLGFRWMLDLLDRVMLSTGVRFGKDLLLFRKSILTLEGVVADVYGDGTFDSALISAAVGQFSRELPSRPITSLTSRDFGTHLSNLDLISLYWGIPVSASKFWGNFWKSWLVGFGKG
jgi:ubiquinone biosynthesis protein